MLLWSLHNRPSAVTATFQVMKTHHTPRGFRISNQHKGGSKVRQRSILDGHVKKIREILKSGGVTIWAVSYRLNIDEGVNFYGVLTKKLR